MSIILSQLEFSSTRMERVLTATNEMFGAIDAAMLRAGVAVVLLGILLLALDFTLKWLSLELIVALCLAGAILMIIGAIGCCHRRREERESSHPTPLTQGKVS